MGTSNSQNFYGLSLLHSLVPIGAFFPKPKNGNGRAKNNKNEEKKENPLFESM